MANPFTPTFDALPRTLAIFPLPGALLLPGQQLPLNIFEPRYLRMVLDALGEGRSIGMIQPDPRQPPAEPPAIYRIGCAGRITTFQETDDGRLLISLTGMCRFAVAEEVEMRGGYRRVHPDWSAFAGDLGAPPEEVIGDEHFVDSLRGYLEAKGLRADWDELAKIDRRVLVDLLSMKLPLATEEKQSLLEAETRVQRAERLVAALQMGAASAGDEPPATLH